MSAARDRSCRAREGCVIRRGGRHARISTPHAGAPIVKLVKLSALAGGVGLLALLVSGVDLAEVWAHGLRFGLVGIAAVLTIYAIAFALDTLAWQLALIEAPLDLRWWYRIWKIRLVGELLNRLVPAGGVGGEPVKALMLKRFYGFGYREGTASLILGKTTDMMSLVLFMATAYVLVLASDALPGVSTTVVGAGLAAFGVAIALFYLMQRHRLSSLLGDWLNGPRPSRWLRLDGLLHHVRDVDDRLSHFYTNRRRRFLACLALGFLNWALGALEVYVVLSLLGYPVSLQEAWIIEGVTQLVRNGTFFIPASVGTQDGALLLLVGAVTGSPELGLTVALVRRARELVWFALGALVGWRYISAPVHAGHGEPA